MHQSHTHQYDEADDLLNHSLSEADLDKPALGVDELHLARIDEYEQVSLRKKDPLMACLGASNANLLRISLRYEHVIIEALDAADTNILDSPLLQRAMKMELGITRQVDRFAKVEIQQGETERQAEQGRSQRRLAALERPTSPAPRRNRY